MDHRDHSEAALNGVRCCYCEVVVVEGVFIECAQCIGVYLCLQCFSCGVDIGTHQRNHDYRVTMKNKTNRTPVKAATSLLVKRKAPELADRLHVFDEKWTSAEDETLIEAVEQFGFGSWQDVASCVKTKDPDECEKHYCDYYIEGNIGKASAVKRPMKCVDESDECYDLFSPISLSVIDQQELGYMALRDDFEREFNNDAELLLCDIAINYDDTPVDIAFKLFQVDTYRHQLRERQWRKNLAKECDVLHNSTSLGFRAYYSAKKKQTREERQFHEKFHVFARFISQTHYNRFHRNLFRQKKLLSNVKTLAKFSERGVKSFKGKFKMHAMQMNGALNGLKKKRRKRHNCYR